MPRKKKLNNHPNPHSEKVATPDSTSLKISKLTIYWIAIGLILLVLGYLLLSKTNPAGDNFASDISPVLLTLGYTAIGVALFFIS